MISTKLRFLMISSRCRYEAMNSAQFSFYNSEMRYLMRAIFGTQPKR